MHRKEVWSPAALGAAALTIPVWSTSYVGTRFALHAYSPMALALLRFLVASSALALYGRSKGIGLPRGRDIPLFVGTGFLGIFLYMWCFNVGHQTVPAATGAFLIAVAPIFTAINAAIAHKTRLAVRGWLGMLTSLVGVGLIAFAEKPASGINRGVFLILFAAWLLSVYNVLVKPLSARYSPLAITLYTFCGGTLFMLFFTPDLVRELPRASLYATLVAIGLGLFPAALGYALWSYALARAPAANVASFMYVTPVLTMLLGWAWLGEWPRTLSLLGGAVALSGVVVTNLRLRR
jgi:drug/metabolite transporter (DMT)-like permease